MKSSLRWEQIKNANDIWEIVYPAEFDIENVEFIGKNIDGSDFRLVTGLRWKHIKNVKK